MVPISLCRWDCIKIRDIFSTIFIITIAEKTIEPSCTVIVEYLLVFGDILNSQ